MARPSSIANDPDIWTSLDLHSLRVTEDQFYRLCRDNPDFRLELTAEGELIVMPPAFPGTGWREFKINQRLANWAEKDGTGIGFSPSSIFTLPNGAKRAPDASWISRSRWESLSEEQRERKFSAICPDFVVQLRSRSDRLYQLRKKMEEYIENGARLGWLLDPLQERVYVHRPGRTVERLENPEYVSGEDVLPGFKFNFEEIV